MAELNPVLLLPYDRSEFSRKHGGGGTPEPLVPVSAGLRTRLTGELDALATEASSRRASSSMPMAVKVELREQALAKSRRPYKFLQSAALPAVGAANPGELIVAGTSDRLRGLAAAITGGSSKSDLYAISTFERFAPWTLDRDVFGVSGRAEVEALLQQAAREERYLQLTFFPWVGRMLSRAATPQGAITSSEDGRPSELLARYSSMLRIEVHTANPSLNRPVLYTAPGALATAAQADEIPGLRAVSLAPRYEPIRSEPQTFIPLHGLEVGEVSLPSGRAPVVGVLDTGVQSSLIEPAVSGRERFNVPADRDPMHGTFVAGLVVDAFGLNGRDDRFPSDSSRVFDAEVMPGAGIDEPLLFQRISDALGAAPDVRIWNCSFAAHPWGTPDYGPFAQDLDLMSDGKQVLFVQAAGNYLTQPRPWPVPDGGRYNDVIGSPAEAVRSLTVGARAHLGGYVPREAPSSYTRKGPNFAVHVKPDVSHWGGDVGVTGALSGEGINSVLPSNKLGESVGTSFATPIVSTIAANVWAGVAESGATSVRPELVKGLLVHSAALNAGPIPADHRHYMGWGIPAPSAEILGQPVDRFTTVHEVVMTPGSDWVKRPLPVPAKLLTSSGKFQGQVLLTVSYAPPLNPAFGSEAVRYDVAGAFGSVESGADGVDRFTAVTKPDLPGGAYWEKDRVQDGKWSPLKNYRARFPQGKSGGEWALRLSLTERVSDEVQSEQRVFAILTFLPLQPGIPIYQDGIEALRRLRYPNSALVNEARLRV
jgi:serine protease AprX